MRRILLRILESVLCSAAGAATGRIVGYMMKSKNSTTVESSQASKIERKLCQEVQEFEREPPFSTIENLKEDSEMELQKSITDADKVFYFSNGDDPTVDAERALQESMAEAEKALHSSMSNAEESIQDSIHQVDENPCHHHFVILKKTWISLTHFLSHKVQYCIYIHSYVHSFEDTIKFSFLLRNLENKFAIPLFFF